jgi:hypothetical protein
MILTTDHLDTIVCVVLYSQIVSVIILLSVGGYLQVAIFELDGQHAAYSISDGIRYVYPVVSKNDEMFRKNGKNDIVCILSDGYDSRRRNQM